MSYTILDKRIINVRDFNNPDQYSFLVFVAIRSNEMLDLWKCYMAVVRDMNTFFVDNNNVDIQRVASSGSKVYKELAKTIFPLLDIEKFEQ